jgi:hypothetical protein
MSIIYFVSSRLCPDLYYSIMVRNAKRGHLNLLKTSKQEDTKKLGSDTDMEIRMLVDDWEELKSDKMLKIARKYDLVIPVMTENNDGTHWNRKYDDQLYLNSSGRNSIRKQLREEQKWKRERVSIYGTLTLGILGSLIGLISIWKK